jgi:hypothetical protein
MMAMENNIDIVFVDEYGHLMAVSGIEAWQHDPD